MLPFVVAGIAVAVGYFFITCFWLVRMNSDVLQHEFAGLLAGVGRGEIDRETLALFVSLQGWKGRELDRRMAHALTLAGRITSGSEREAAIDAGNSLVAGKFR